MREVELKAVVDSMATRIANVERAGGRIVFRGRLEDCRYDTADRQLSARDIVLRLRTYRDEHGTRAELGWKGPTQYEDGYKVRDEVTATSADGDAIRQILERLGFVVTREIEREVTVAFAAHDEAEHLTGRVADIFAQVAVRLGACTAMA